MIQGALASVAVGAFTYAAMRREHTGNAMFVAILFGLLAVFGPAVGAY